MDDIPIDLAHERIICAKSLGMLASCSRAYFERFGPQAKAQVASGHAVVPVFSHLGRIVLRERGAQSFRVWYHGNETGLEFEGFNQHLVGSSIGTPRSIAFFRLHGLILGMKDLLVIIAPISHRTGHLTLVSGVETRAVGYLNGPIPALEALGVK
jgi:hypothetical protein